MEQNKWNIFKTEKKALSIKNAESILNYRDCKALSQAICKIEK